MSQSAPSRFMPGFIPPSTFAQRLGTSNALQLNPGDRLLPGQSLVSPYAYALLPSTNYKTQLTSQDGNFHAFLTDAGHFVVALTIPGFPSRVLRDNNFNQLVAGAYPTYGCLYFVNNSRYSFEIIRQIGLGGPMVALKNLPLPANFVGSSLVLQNDGNVQMISPSGLRSTV